MSVLSVGITFSFVDDKNKTSTTKLHIPTGLTIAQITTFASTSGQVLADFSNCRVTRVSPCIGIDLSELSLPSAGATSDWWEKAIFTMRTAFNTVAKVLVPTFRDTMIVDGSDSVDVTDPDVAAFITALEDGIVTTGGTIAPVDLRDNDVSEVTASKELFSKS